MPDLSPLGNGKDAHEQLKRNTGHDFAGLDGVKARQREQLNKFERWAAKGDWGRFHGSHYDWWMFPIDRTSGGEGAKWTVYAGDVEELKGDPDFVRDYLRGVELLMAAWGWDLSAAALLPGPSPDQRWQHHPVRLFKAARSLRLFGFETEFASLKKYAQILMDQGEAMFYGGHDLRWLFTTGVDPEKYSP